MAERLTHGLWWLHGTRGSNVFLVEADDGRLALVDTAFGTSAGPIVREIAGAGAGRPLSLIMLTHRHTDHSGAAAQVREQTGAEVVAGLGDCREEDGAPVIRPSLGRSHAGRLFRRRFGADARPIPVAHPIAEETEVLPGIRAIPVPGHTPGSLCFVVDRIGAAFVGDLVISHRGRLARSMQSANGDDRLYLRTMAEFAATAPEIGLPGHGTPIMTGFGDALRELAALPRRAATPRTMAERAVRMASFTHGMVRRRSPARR